MLSPLHRCRLPGRALAAWSITLALALAPPPTALGAEKRAPLAVLGADRQPMDLTQPLTLERAIAIALANQPQLAIAQSQIQASQARVRQAMSSYYPQIAPLYEYTNQKTAFGGSSAHVEQGITQIGLRQLIYDTGKREVNVAASRSNARAAGFNLADTRQSVILNVAASYYEMLRRRDLVRVSEASVERARTTLEATRAFVQEGTVRRIDILQAQADYDNVVVQLSQARNDAQLAQLTLKNAMGIVSPVVVSAPEAALPRPAPEPDKATAQQLVESALANRMDLQRERESIEATRQSVKLARINAGLQVQADVTEGYRVDPDPGENRTFVTSFTYPLFDAGLTRSRVHEAQASLEQARQQQELTRQDILLAVQQAYLQREEARQRVSATESALTAAQANYTAASEGYREGAGTIIDVITAQTQLVTAETNAVQAVYDYYSADARLRRAVGDNDPYAQGGART
ncbi:MAG: TolC family protein [Chthonomonadales bacterium]|nr:TolC family protein [Chthonomonadales bacterium]